MDRASSPAFRAPSALVHGLFLTLDRTRVYTLHRVRALSRCCGGILESGELEALLER